MLDDVGRRLAEIRSARGWTQEEAAEELGLSVRMIRKLEAGANTTILRLATIASAYGVPMTALFEAPHSRAERRPGRPPSRRS